jgi:hypothetical protein
MGPANPGRDQMSQLTARQLLPIYADRLTNDGASALHSESIRYSCTSSPSPWTYQSARDDH